jgi:hypothetical protein
MSAIDRIRQATRRQSNEFHAANISTPHGWDKLRLGREMERELGLYSFNNSSADSNGSPRQQHVANDHTRDYSLDYKGGDTDTADSNEFFPRSPAPSTHDLSKHFRDFSMHGIESSIDSVELPRGGKEMGSPEVHISFHSAVLTCSWTRETLTAQPIQLGINSLSMILISLLKCILSHLTVVRPHSPILEMSIEDFQPPITLRNTILKAIC